MASAQDGACPDWYVAFECSHCQTATANRTGFFHSMFMGGFSETSRRSSRKGKERMLWADDDTWAGEDIELQFDDPNITRAAFE